MDKISQKFIIIKVLIFIFRQGQRVPIDKQTPKLTEQMIRQCQVLPAAMQEQITIQRDQGMLQNMNSYFTAHNVRIDPHLCKTEASMLFPPAIQYNPDRVEPSQNGGFENIFFILDNI